MKMTARDYGLAAAAFALLLDQVSKLLLLYGYDFKSLPPGAAVKVLPFFNLVMVWNPGISYGLFPAHSRLGSIILVAISLIAVSLLIWWLWVSTRSMLTIGLGLIVGGAIGNNLIDRLVYGKVADFFEFYAYGYDWYVFNIADAAITFGVIVLVYDALMRPEPRPGQRTGLLE